MSINPALRGFFIGEKMARILIVDDDAALRSMLSMVLEGEGHEVMLARDRPSALAQLQQHAFDVLFLDMGMPPHEHTTEEGVKVLAWLQAHPRRLKTIVLTGQDPAESAFVAIRHGAFDYLSKPVDEVLLRHALERALLFLENEQRLRDEAGEEKLTLTLPVGEGVKPVRNRAEELMLRKMLEETDYNVHETARRLNLNRENVYYLLKKYGIRRPQKEE